MRVIRILDFDQDLYRSTVRIIRVSVHNHSKIQSRSSSGERDQVNPIVRCWVLWARVGVVVGAIGGGGSKNLKAKKQVGSIA